MKREWLYIFLWILIYIAVRSIHFIDALNFSQDQAADSLRGLLLYREHAFTLIGTHTGYVYNGRLLFQGPLFIYTYLFFNILGHFDPIVSTYLFVIMGSLSVVPLYYGLKRLGNAMSALIGIAMYSLLPYFVDYSRFLWNPNFQLVSTPFLIYSFARYHTGRGYHWLVATTVLLGLLLQDHYQYILLILSFGVYLLVQRRTVISILTLIGGIMFGFLPVLLFEVRHDFYNLRTGILFLQHYREVFLLGNSVSVSNHFFLSPTLVLLVILVTRFHRLITPIVASGVVGILMLFALLTFKTPDRMFNSQTRWRYADELKVYSIIQKYNLTHANISLLHYDNEAVVQKFFLKRDKRTIAQDYYHNQYLFAVSETGKLNSYRAYEIRIFQPRIIVKSWPITDRYTLYLLKRGEK